MGVAQKREEKRGRGWKWSGRKGRETHLAHGVAKLVVRVAGLEAEGVGAHEVVPLNNLLVSRSARGGSVGGAVAAERVREDETSEGVTTVVGTVRVLQEVANESKGQGGRRGETHHLSSVVLGKDIDRRLVDVTDDLDVVRSLWKGR